MKLRYLTLCADFINQDLPYTSEELRSFSIQLRHESAFITDYIKRKLNEEFKFDFLRLNLACKPLAARNDIILIDSIPEIEVLFSMNYFFMSAAQKKKYLIDVTENGLRRFCECKGWDFSVLEKHFDQLRENNFSVEFYIPDKSCRNGQYSSKVYCVQNMTESIFFLDFFFKRTLIERKLFAVSRPTAEAYRTNIYRMKWEENSSVSIYNWTGQLYGQVAFDMDILKSGSDFLTYDLNQYRECVDHIYAVKSLLCKQIGEDVQFCNIEEWKENEKGEIFVVLLLLRQINRRHTFVIDLLGNVTETRDTGDGSVC